MRASHLVLRVLPPVKSLRGDGRIRSDSSSREKALQRRIKPNCRTAWAINVLLGSNSGQKQMDIKVEINMEQKVKMIEKKKIYIYLAKNKVVRASRGRFSAHHLLCIFPGRKFWKSFGNHLSAIEFVGRDDLLGVMIGEICAE